MATSAPWPGHDPFTTSCTDYPVGLDIGELAPGHHFIVRGVCMHLERMWLYYAWTPGLTEMDDVWFSIEYDADVTPTDYSYLGSRDISGGEFSEGERGYYERPPAGARRIWFDFHGMADDDHPVCRVTIDLVTKQVLLERYS